MLCMFYRTPPTVFSVLRKPSSRRVHSPVDRLCRHAARAVRSLGTPLWIPFWIGTPTTSGLLKRPAQAVHRKIFGHWIAEPGRPSYPHKEFDVQRQVAASLEAPLTLR